MIDLLPHNNSYIISEFYNESYPDFIKYIYEIFGIKSSITDNIIKFDFSDY
jgi:hypothetical protein